MWKELASFIRVVPTAALSLSDDDSFSSSDDNSNNNNDDNITKKNDHSAEEETLNLQYQVSLILSISNLP